MADNKYSCQALGICKYRYPACGRCDDDHPEDESPTAMEQIHAWCIAFAFALAAFFVTVVAVGWVFHLALKLWPR